MATVKPTKPAKQLPSSFGGVKTEFSADKIQNGFQESIPDILAGDVLNHLLDTLGKNQEFFNAVADLIINTPVNKFMITNINNKVEYIGFGNGLSLSESLLQLALAAGLKFDDTKKLSLNLGGGLKINNGKLEVNTGAALTLNESDNTVGVKYHDSLRTWNNNLGASFLISLSQAENMTDNIIRPQVTRTIIRKTITEATTFTFDNSGISSIFDNTHVTLELHLNMKTVSAINFNPAVEWDGGEAPDMSEAGKDYWLVLRTEDKGASWKGSLGSTFDGY